MNLDRMNSGGQASKFLVSALSALFTRQNRTSLDFTSLGGGGCEELKVGPER